MNHTISDMIIRIKNAARARRKLVYLPQSNVSRAIAQVLIKERFLSDIKDDVIDGRNMLVAEIRYNNNAPLLTDVKVISKPSLRVYKDHREVRGRGVGMTVVSTSKGVMTGKEAAEKGLGGEILFSIW
mgnify:CR=1 FL=1